MKLICEKTTFIPGFCVFYVAPQWMRRVTTTGELDYLPFTDRCAEWLTGKARNRR